MFFLAFVIMTSSGSGRGVLIFFLEGGYQFAIGGSCFARRVGLLIEMMPIRSNSTGLNMANSPQLERCLDGLTIQGANWLKDT